MESVSDAIPLHADDDDDDEQTTTKTFDLQICEIDGIVEWAWDPGLKRRNKKSLRQWELDYADPYARGSN